VDSYFNSFLLTYSWFFLKLNKKKEIMLALMAIKANNKVIAYNIQILEKRIQNRVI
jgi:hypothetical protein